MMMKDKRVIWLILSMLVCGWACSDKTIIYNPEQKRSIYFYKDVNRYASKVVPDTIEFSFAALEESEYRYDIPVKFIGMPIEKEIECEVEVVADSTTAEAGKHYEMGKIVFPEGEVEGMLSLRLKRTEDIQKHPVMIYMRLREDENFVPMENECYRLSVVDGVLVAPGWWASGYLGVYANGNYKLYRKMLEYYWELEELKPVFYAETVKEYGRYLEKAPAGFFQQPNNIVWIKYVFKPAYEFYSDPENTYDGFDMVNPDRFIR